MSAALGVYLAGVALALWRADAGWPLRVVLSVLWPIGPLAFAVTISILVAASLIAFPVIGIAVAAAVTAWWLLGG